VWVAHTLVELQRVGPWHGFPFLTFEEFLLPLVEHEAKFEQELS